MARENRRENRKAAKEILEGGEENVNKADPKLAMKDQLDFFDKTSSEGFLDIGDTDDEDEQDLTIASTNDSEVEGEVKTPAPNVEKKNVEKKEGEEEATDEGEVESIEGDETDGEDEKVAAEKVPSPEVKEPAKLETDATKDAAPAPEVKKEPEKVKSSELSNEEASALYTEWRTTTEDLLANHHYRLDETQVEELNANPAAIIPKLMSKVYMDSISAAFQQFANYLPRMVGQVIEQRNSMNAAETAFFTKWPALADKKDTVMRLGQAYRTSNPSASMDDFINEVGAQAMVALRLMPAGTTPVSKPTKNGPFKPAIETPAPVSTPSKSTNPIENLMAEFSDDYSEEDMD